MVKIPKRKDAKNPKLDRPCGVIGCGKSAVRSVSRNTVKEKKLNVSDAGKRVHLCQDHYKSISKKSKKDKLYEKWRREG